MLSRNNLDRIHDAFDDHRQVPNAGPILPFMVAYHLDWANRWATMLPWEMHRVGRMRDKSCGR